LPATRVATGAVRSYRTFSPLPRRVGWTLKSCRARFHARLTWDGVARVHSWPGHSHVQPTRRGGIFSVPLSFGSPRPGVTRHTALRSSDFPLSTFTPGLHLALRRTAIVWPAANARIVLLALQTWRVFGSGRVWRPDATYGISLL